MEDTATGRSQTALQRVARLAIVLCAPLGATIAATSATSVSDGTDAGLTRVECLSDDPGYTDRFRGGVIDTGAGADAAYEVILTTAHGLPRDVASVKERCSVIGVQDERYAIEAVWRPPVRGYAGIDDWAVLLTERRFDDPVVRLRTPASETAARRRLLAGGVDVRLPLRFIGAERDCGLVRPASRQALAARELFAHTCRAWSGHSGSPIVITVDGQPYIHGLHLGNQWLAEERTFIEIGRYLDETILQAIEVAARHGSARPGRARRR